MIIPSPASNSIESPPLPFAQVFQRLPMEPPYVDDQEALVGEVPGAPAAPEEEGISGRELVAVVTDELKTKMLEGEVTEGSK